LRLRQWRFRLFCRSRAEHFSQKAASTLDVIDPFLKQRAPAFHVGFGLSQIGARLTKIGARPCQRGGRFLATGLSCRKRFALHRERRFGFALFRGRR